MERRIVGVERGEKEALGSGEMCQNEWKRDGGGGLNGWKTG